MNLKLKTTLNLWAGAAVLAAAAMPTAAWSQNLNFDSKCSSNGGVGKVGWIHSVVASTGSESGTWVTLRERTVSAPYSPQGSGATTDTYTFYKLSYSTAAGPHPEMMNRLAELAYLNQMPVNVCLYSGELNMIGLKPEAVLPLARRGSSQAGTR